MAYVNKNAGTIVARIAGEMPEMDAAAERVRTAVEAGADAITKSGQFASSIHVERVAGKRGVVDRLVYSDDPGAYSIEFGHATKSGRDVPGHFVFTNTLHGMRG